MLQSMRYWFEDHEIMGTVVKIMLCSLLMGVFIGFVSGGVASLAGYGYLLKPFVCWAICVCLGLGALLCLLFLLYAIFIPKM